jgi:hypothetical protein
MNLSFPAILFLPFSIRAPLFQIYGQALEGVPGHKQTSGHPLRFEVRINPGDRSAGLEPAAGLDAPSLERFIGQNGEKVRWVDRSEVRSGRRIRRV